MFLQLCKSKIHQAVVTQAHIDYEGSITIDRELMDAAAKLAKVGDKITVMAFAYCTPEEAKAFIHTNILLNQNNEVVTITPAGVN